MARYLIDVNLPYYFSLWRDEPYIHLRDIDDEWSDGEVWSYAREQCLTMVTEDADFSNRVLIHPPPPRVIHVRLGNLRMRDFHRRIADVWMEVCELSGRCRLIQIFADRLEGIDQPPVSTTSIQPHSVGLASSRGRT